MSEIPEKLDHGPSGMARAVDALQDPVLVLDLDDRIITGNKAFFAMIGATADGVRGVDAKQYLHNEKQDQTCPVCQARRDRCDILITLEADDPNNRHGKPMEYEIKVLRDQGNKPVGIVQRLRDLTQQREIENALRQSEKRFRGLLETAPDPMVITDRQGKIILVNSQAENTFGYERGQMLGQSVEILVPSSLRESHVSSREQYTQHPVTRPMEKSVDMTAVRSDGSEFPVAVSLSPLTTDSGVYITAVVRDISRQLKEERDLTRLASFPELNPLPILEIHLDGTPAYMNPAAVDLFPDLPSRQFKHPFLHGVDQFIQKCRDDGEAILRDIEIKQHFFEQKIVYIPESDLIRIYAWDITSMREMTRKLAYQTAHDPLTGLINRDEFERRLEQEVQSAIFEQREHALCYLDLDQFKIVNDTCGHIAGDTLLKQLSVKLRDSLRGSDTLARLGGDEFALLLVSCPLDRAVQIAEKLREVIGGFRFDWEGKNFTVGASIGVVPITAASGTSTDVLSAADAACYIAKDNGRDRVHLGMPGDEVITQRTSEMNWTQRIREALDADRFTLFCQQIKPLHRSGPSHYEVLVRMLNDDGSIVPPMAFIPAAERYSLMPAIDRWVLRNALEFLKNDSGEDLRLAINLSGHSLSNMAVLNYIVEELDHPGINGERVSFEITETAAVANLSHARHFISTLKSLGCRFALDDFGSGVSSFAYLKTLPVDYLKIDGVIVKGMAEDPISWAMVESINKVGHVMGIKTIAEFVENDVTREQLRLLGVDYGQGFGIHKPEPIADVLPKNPRRVAN